MSFYTFLFIYPLYSLKHSTLLRPKTNMSAKTALVRAKFFMATHLFDTRIVELRKMQFTDPIAFGGFVGPGLVGLVTSGYIIEKLNLHEIAHVQSQHIPPVAVFVGAKLRHPFRIYSDSAGKVIVMHSEMPIEVEGLYDVSSVLLDWLEKIHVREVVVLDGVAVNGMRDHHQTFCVADEERCRELERAGIHTIESALISGVGGSILNQCLSRRIRGVSLLSDSSTEFPDPGAPLSIIRAINAAYSLAIATDELEQNVARLNEHLNKLTESYNMLQNKTNESDKQLYG